MNAKEIHERHAKECPGSGACPGCPCAECKAHAAKSGYEPARADYALYAVHSRGGFVQYAGHLLLWDSTEAEARTIAAGMCRAPIVGVEIAKQDRTIGSVETRVCCIGQSYTEAQNV